MMYVRCTGQPTISFGVFSLCSHHDRQTHHVTALPFLILSKPLRSPFLITQSMCYVCEWVDACVFLCVYIFSWCYWWWIMLSVRVLSLCVIFLPHSCLFSPSSFFHTYFTLLEWNAAVRWPNWSYRSFGFLWFFIAYHSVEPSFLSFKLYYINIIVMLWWWLCKTIRRCPFCRMNMPPYTRNVFEILMNYIRVCEHRKYIGFEYDHDVRVNVPRYRRHHRRRLFYLCLY